jgi:class 3 adenylate cyclase
LRQTPLILAVDDVSENLDIVKVRLEANGYAVATAADGEEALVQTHALRPDLILLDVMMPKLDGISVLKQLKQDKALGFIPIILLTAKADRSDIVAGLDAGGDDYLTKPFDQAALVARVRAMLRIKMLHDIVEQQAERLAEQAKTLSNWNATLEARVNQQVSEIERMSRLKRFLSPQIADIIAASGNLENLLESHRREVTVVFCDLRGFTAFTEIAEPEEVMVVLNEYHQTLGVLIDQYEGTLERFVGDGLLTLFNDPLPCPNHTERAVHMALDMREAIGKLSELWRRRGHELGFGIGIALGYATLGRIGFTRRFDYSAVGSVTNLASRLCDEAKPGQILTDQRAYNMIEGLFKTRPLEAMKLKGFRRQIEAYEIIKAEPKV